MANTFELISSVTVGAGGASSILFTSIPQTYTDLCVKFSLRLSASGNVGGFLKLNGTITNPRTLLSTGSAVSSEVNNLTGFADSFSYTASTFSNCEIYVPNYTLSQNKSFSFDGVTENNSSTAYMSISAGLISNTSPTTSLEILGDTLAQYSTAYLYGVKNA